MFKANEIDIIGEKLQSQLKGEKRRRYSRFTLAALGSIPWIGGFLSASAAMNAEKDQAKINELQRQWLEDYKVKIYKLGETLEYIINRLESFDEEVMERVESEEYLNIVRKGFREWDKADTDEKRNMIRNLLTNAGATKLCPDDLVRLFLDWIDKYHEAHFKVIREIFKNKGITRAEIWNKIGEEKPKENSAEADVFKLLVDDLSLGHVIRQKREVDSFGNFIKTSRKGKSRSRTMKSAFDDTYEHELTELGGQFVHYTMNEAVLRIDE